MIDFHVVDAGAARTVANASLESLDRLGFSFSRDFDAAVVQVPHPAVHAFAARRVLREKPKADALYTPADQEMARDPHTRKRRHHSMRVARSGQGRRVQPSGCFGVSVFAGSGLSGSFLIGSSF